MEYPLKINKSCFFEEFIKHMAAPGNNSAMKADIIRTEAIKDFGLERKDRNTKHDTTWFYYNHEVRKKKLAEMEKTDDNEDERDDLEFEVRLHRRWYRDRDGFLFVTFRDGFVGRRNCPHSGS